eukprot:scaffold1954_cov268-Pinguiococcus_pyrenoidosus.AAC.112
MSKNVCGSRSGRYKRRASLSFVWAENMARKTPDAAARTQRWTRKISPATSSSRSVSRPCLRRCHSDTPSCPALLEASLSPARALSIAGVDGGGWLRKWVFVGHSFSQSTSTQMLGSWEPRQLSLRTATNIVSPLFALRETSVTYEAGRRA